jgi:SAM-dependent methyltransferase
MAEKHFFEQKQFSENYLIPYFRRHCPGFDGFRILEVGCAEGGFLAALSDQGIRASGLELLSGRVEASKALNPALDIRVGDITNPENIRSIGGPFDLIVLRDVVEHIVDRKAAFARISHLLKRGGYCYVSFPPRFSPFGGHQQNGRSILRRVPYLHLLPAAGIRFLGGRLREHPHIVDAAIFNRRHGLSIRDFEKLCARFRFRFETKELYVVRPVYRARYGIRPRKMPDLAVLREILTFGCECLLRKK